MNTSKCSVIGLVSILVMCSCSQNAPETSSTFTNVPAPDLQPETNCAGKTGNPALDQELCNTEIVIGNAQSTGQASKQQARQWVSSASCQELTSAAIQQKRAADYWLNAPAIGDGVSVNIPQAKANAALNTLALINSEYSKRC